MKTWLFPGLVLGLAIAAPLFTIACTGGSDDDGTSSPSEEDEIKKKKGGAEGAACSDAKPCQTGLLCKVKSSGPPPGAVGLPLPPGSSRSSGPPPGAVGLPMPPETTCQKPAAGEEGGPCKDDGSCAEGLKCVYPQSNGGGGPPPGAVGLPLPPSAGTCKVVSSGPPPGAVGLPLPNR